MYPLLQGWDSVNIEADIEIGGTDQTFNLLVGRDLQEQMGQRPQIVMTHELLVGTDGTQKMSQSLGNYVGLTDSAGRHVRQDDVDPGRGDAPVVPPGVGARRGRAVAATVAALDGGELEPVEAKRRLARAIAARYHGDARRPTRPPSGSARVFGRREVPGGRARARAAAGETVHLPALLVDALGSRRAPRRAGASPRAAVRVDGEQLRELDVARAERSPAGRSRWGAASCASSSA